MKLSSFNFNLPKELAALYPAPNRDEARLMVVHRKTGKIEHKVFKDSLKYFEAILSGMKFMNEQSKLIQISRSYASRFKARKYFGR